MLDGIGQTHLHARAYRYAAENRRIESLRELGLDLDDIDEVLDLIKDKGPTSLDDYLDFPFKQPLTRSDPSLHRFSDGIVHILYTATQPETAEAEVLARRARILTESSKDQVPIYFMLLSCQFSGSSIDLRPHLERFPFLVGTSMDSYDQCARLGSEVASQGIDGMLTPSARRRPEGDCLPVFQRRAVADPRRENVTAFVFDSATASFRRQTKSSTL